MNRREQIEAVRQAQRTAQVRDSRDRYDRGERLCEDRQDRPWYCRSCGHIAHGPVIPRGRYSLSRHSGDRETKPVRLGIYCSAACLDPQMPRLIGVEAAAGDRWQDTGHYRQAPS